MKQKDVMVGGIVQTKINGRLCDVRITGKRVTPATTWSKARTLFDWVRLNPPIGAHKINGSDTAAALREVK